uniref:Acetylcholinesterase n=1 Tax=Parastrongyloides trichosuri TaxID=131310 RepID=A0A0N4ZD90_PARTI
MWRINFLTFLLYPSYFRDCRIAQTKCGQYYGNTLTLKTGRVTEYLGIPYAQPPTDLLRFVEPQPSYCYPWDWKFYFDRPAYSCPQVSMLYNLKNDKNWGKNIEFNEDCLQLNIWLPDKPSGSVLVFFHGGLFSKGSGSMDIYNGSVLATLTNATVVTVNYRLGALGFSFFKNGTWIPGNLGLKDQQFALKWIHQNIKSFYSDPNKVTIIGEDAGGASITAHLLSSESRKYFKRAIVLSGHMANPWALRDSRQIEKYTEKLQKLLVCTRARDKNYVMKCMQRRQIKDVLKAEKKIYEEEKQRIFGAPFVLSNYDRSFFNTNISDKFNGTPIAFPKNVEFMAGNTNEEGLLYMMKKYFKNDLLKSNGAGGYYYHINKTYFNQIFREVTDKINLTQLQQEKLNKTYFSKINRRDQVLSRLAADVLFDCDLDRYSNKLIRARNKSFYAFRFQIKSPLDIYPWWAGSIHGTPIEYLFGKPFRYPGSYKRSELIYEQKFSSAFIKIFSDFAYNGSVNKNWTYPKDHEMIERNITFSIIDGYVLLNKRHTLRDECKLIYKIPLNTTKQIKNKSKTSSNKKKIFMKAEENFCS